MTGSWGGRTMGAEIGSVVLRGRVFARRDLDALMHAVAALVAR